MNARNEFVLHCRRMNAIYAPVIAKAAKNGSPNERHAEWIASLKAETEKNERILVIARWNPHLNEAQLIAKAG